MKVSIQYIDDDSLVSEEALHNIRIKYGDNTAVEITPQDSTPEGYIKFAIRELVTIEQLEFYFDYKDSVRGYNEKIRLLKDSIITKVEKLFDDVIEENEKRLD